MTTTIEKGTVWFPKHKSRGVYLTIEEADDEMVTVKRHDKGQDPHLQVLRVKTLTDRYEKELTS